MKKDFYNKATAYIFAIITILHLLRILKGWEVNIGGLMIPVWVSLLAIFVAGYLSYKGFSIRNG